ncbi:hypothetical protein BKA81DRAFT_224521 [Phyllosticta paracitricarpa]
MGSVQQQQQQQQPHHPSIHRDGYRLPLVPELTNHLPTYLPTYLFPVNNPAPAIAQSLAHAGQQVINSSQSRCSNQSIDEHTISGLVWPHAAMPPTVYLHNHTPTRKNQRRQPNPHARTTERLAMLSQAKRAEPPPGVQQTSRVSAQSGMGEPELGLLETSRRAKSPNRCRALAELVQLLELVCRRHR